MVLKSKDLLGLKDLTSKNQYILDTAKTIM